MNFDQQIVTNLNSLLSNPICGWLFYLLGVFLIWLFFIPFLWLIFIHRQDGLWKRYLKLAAISAFFLIAALAVNQLVGMVWFRERPVPEFEIGNVLSTVAGTKSFPSDHTTAAFTLAIPLFFVSWQWGWAGVLAGLLIGFSRVVLGVHWPTDILAGIILGTLWGLLSGFIFKKLSKK
jgi:undecaprenyl-diphosphatase